MRKPSLPKQLQTSRSLVSLLLFILPVMAFVLGHMLFDLIGEPFSRTTLDATAAKLNAFDHQQAITDGHVWAAVAHFYLVASFFVLALLIIWQQGQIRGVAAMPYWATAAALSVLGLGYLKFVDQTARPIKAIFLFTYRSLALTGLLKSGQRLASVELILTIINILGVVVPSLLIAFLPILILPPRHGWSEAELLRRMRDARMLGAAASVFMVGGVLHMYAWLSWAPNLISNANLEPMTAGVTLYWGCVFTTMLGLTYLPILLVLQRAGETVMDEESIPSKDRSQWLCDRGLSFKFITQLPQVIGIFAPLIAAPASRLLANLPSLLSG